MQIKWPSIPDSSLQHGHPFPIKFLEQFPIKWSFLLRFNINTRRELSIIKFNLSLMHSLQTILIPFLYFLQIPLILGPVQFLNILILNLNLILNNFFLPLIQFLRQILIYFRLDPIMYINILIEIRLMQLFNILIN